MGDDVRLSHHDALFKRAFTELRNAAGLLRSLLPPELVEAVDWSTLALCEGSMIDSALRGRASDLLFSARSGDADVLFYVLVEHQSRPDPRMAWRLWMYVTRVWERWMRTRPAPRRLPRVIPIVIYHGARRWNAARCISELVEDQPPLGSELADLLPRFRYILDDLARLPPQALRERGLPAFAALALWALRAAPRRRFAQTVGVFRDLFDEVLASADGAAALGTILRYLSVVTRDDDRAIVDDVLAQLSEPVREEAMSYYDRLIQQGEEKGRAEGKAEGLVEGRRAVLEKLLALKFGVLSDGARARIEGASGDELDRMAERVLTAATVDEVLA